MKRLVDLCAHFTQVMPLGTGIFTGLYYLCPNDPRGKRAHAVLFKPPINPYAATFGAAQLEVALAANPHWAASPKWDRSGDTIETLTLTPSIAQPCCHITIANGGVSP